MNDRRRQGLEKEISRIIGTTLLTEIKNEKINRLVTIKETVLSKDGKYVDLFFSILDLDENLNKEKLVEELNKLKGFFRKKIGSELTIRHTPEVRIHIDNTTEYGIRISSILNKIVKKDSEWCHEMGVIKL